ncbi:MAG: hypothetical protein WAK55_24810, partial [Xanthobacteraceae bacterium]
AFWQFFAIHQPALLFGWSGRKLHGECVHAGPRYNVDGVLPGRADRRRDVPENRVACKERDYRKAAQTE